MRRGYDVHGFDVSPGMIRLARERVPQARFTCGSMMQVRLPECEAVTLLGEGINNLLDVRDVTRLFARVRRALRPGGVLLVDVLEPAGPRSRAPVRFGPGWAIVTLVREDGRFVERRIAWIREGRAGSELHRCRLYRATDLRGRLRGFRVRIRRFAPRRALVIARKN